MRGRRGLTIDDALRILGAGESNLVKVADRVRRGATVSAALATLGAVDLFDVGAEVMIWARSLASRLDERRSGASRYNRTQLIEAAHGVVVVSSLHEALADVAGHRGTGLWALRSVGGDRPAIMTELWSNGRADLIGQLLASPLPIPRPDRPYEATLFEIRNLYAACTLAVMDKLEPSRGPDGGRPRRPDLPDLALQAYISAFRSLAATVPEFALWAGAIDSEATRGLLTSIGSEVIDRIRAVETGLAGIAEAFHGVSPHATAVDRRRQELHQLYQRRIERPLLDLHEVSDSLAMPSLREAFINPPCRVAVGSTRDLTEQWWAEQPRSTDVQVALLGHLVSPAAVYAPLVIYGHPGSGKSSLCQVLAAVLPANQFTTVVIPLRDVPVDAQVADQVDHGLRLLTNDTVTWAALLETVEDALPVLVLDGLDEMLQASSRERAEYLEEVRRFQQDEADRGRPMAAIVTSRPSVAHRVRTPSDALLLRLEAFDEHDIVGWVQTWNRLTASQRAVARRDDLSTEHVLRYSRIAEQPLLLLLLALYDWRTGSLHELAASTSASLYEAVLRDYALREVRRPLRQGAGDAEERAIELNLRRLSVAAVGMLNRGRTSISGEELDRDLAALARALVGPGADEGHYGSEVSDAYDVISGFYFVYGARATSGVSTSLSSFEFLHATFGEYLAARFVVRSLQDLAAERRFYATRPMSREPDAGLLWAATSFAPLTNRPQVANFCRELVGDLTGDEGAELQSLAVDLLASSLDDHPLWSFRDYEPVRLTGTGRQAAYTANLVLLALMIRGDKIEASKLCGSNKAFYGYTNLWRSQLGRHAVDLSHAIRVRTLVDWETEDSGDMTSEETLWLAQETGGEISLAESTTYVDWRVEANDFFIGTLPSDVLVPNGSSAGEYLREASFYGTSLPAWSVVATIAPYWRHVRADISTVPYGEGAYGTDAGLLFEVLLNESTDPEQIVVLYRTALHRLPKDEDKARVLRQLSLRVPILGDDRTSILVNEAISKRWMTPDALAPVLRAMSDTSAVWKLVTSELDEIDVHFEDGGRDGEHLAELGESASFLDPLHSILQMDLSRRQRDSCSAEGAGRE